MRGWRTRSTFISDLEYVRVLLSYEASQDIEENFEGADDFDDSEVYSQISAEPLTGDMARVGIPSTG